MLAGESIENKFRSKPDTGSIQVDNKELFLRRRAPSPVRIFDENPTSGPQSSLKYQHAQTQDL
jgi:hypothetical protein